MDKLTIEQLRTHCTLGIHTWEQTLKQMLLIDYQVEFNASKTQEDISNTLNYAAIAQCIDEFCKQKSFKLLETLTHALADHLIASFPCTSATLTVHKPYALPHTQSVSLTTSRHG